MYAAGQGVPRDEAKSMGWMQKAANLGDAGAQHHIGMKHHRASLDGLAADACESRIQAYKWLHLAAAQGYRSSDAAWAFVALSMTREDVADGSRRIAAFDAQRISPKWRDSLTSPASSPTPPALF